MSLLLYKEIQQLYRMLEELKGNKSKHVFLLMSHINSLQTFKGSINNCHSIQFAEIMQLDQQY